MEARDAVAVTLGRSRAKLKDVSGKLRVRTPAWARSRMREIDLVDANAIASITKPGGGARVARACRGIVREKAGIVSRGAATTGLVRPSARLLRCVEGRVDPSCHTIGVLGCDA